MRDIVPLWMKIVFGGGTLLMAGAAGVSVLTHGSKQVGFLLMTLSMAGIWFFMGQPTEPTRTYLKRPQGILYLNLDFNFLRLVHSRRKLDSRYLPWGFTRRPLVGSLTVMLIAGIWMSSHLSLGNVAAFVLIICIIGSDIYLHTSSDQKSLALSHPLS